ncbi:hypothetical protein F751_5415 [Auxenochlorella protothecoides]|uniref:Uncharacterized protein n=1 Tax=Auxenochlorella protothecoides TaxID=3075 RepID=A0A087SQ46_AUXPR|nr:hypothetical protein F751_5415 [Auxenochlorella protothecoides]KFM27850.1 hypothetical protein F751_5415 [Auxenochlorella protothecoides]
MRPIAGAPRRRWSPGGRRGSPGARRRPPRPGPCRRRGRRRTSACSAAPGPGSRPGAGARGRTPAGVQAPPRSVAAAG